MSPSEPPPDEPLHGLLRKASPAGDLLAQAALGKLQAKLFGRAAAPIRVGRYAIEERIGAGGGGVVYRALDPEHERKVALKLLHAHDGSGTEAAARDRLLREAQALAKLSHPNVVRILDVGTYDPTTLDPGAPRDAGAPAVYLAMELLEGRELGRWLAEAPRGWQEVREVFVAAGRGLAAAHAHGLVHRDFKPANVSIDGDGRVRVLDFGLARPLAVQPPEPSLRTSIGVRARLDALAKPLAATLTVPGTLLGTPAYMAPEQHERRRATAQSDQYAFCVALYEAWYGQRPFLASREEELRALKLRGDVLPPPASTEVPPHLWAVLRRGLSPRPEDRYESMEALLAALMEPAPRRWRLGRWLTAGGAAGALAIGALAWSTHAGSTADEDASPAIACAKGHIERAAGLRRAARAAEAADRSRLTDVALRWPDVVHCDARHDPELRASDAAVADSLLLAAEGSFDDARVLAARAHERLRAREHGEPARLAVVAAWIGHLALERSELAEAEASLGEALWSDEAVPPRASLLATIDLLELLRRASPRPADAPVWIRLARERAALPAVPPALRLRLYLGLHHLALADGDLARAELDLEQALALPLDESGREDCRHAQAALARARAGEPLR